MICRRLKDDAGCDNSRLFQPADWIAHRDIAVIRQLPESAADGALVLVDPLLVHSVGFRLSVGASVGISLLARPLLDALPGPAPLRSVLAVTLPYYRFAMDATVLQERNFPNLTDSLLRYPLLDDGSGFDFGDDQGLADLVESRGVTIHERTVVGSQ